MRLSRRLLFVCLACTPILLLSGCWSVVELNDRAFARIMLLDASDHGIQMTLGFPLPQRMASGQGGGGGGGGSGGSSEPPFTYVTKSAETVGDAYRQIQADMSRRITFGQLRNVVVGREFAETGLDPFLDFFARVPNIHINANLFITEGDAQRFTKIPVTFERFPTDILTRYAKDEVTVQTTVKDVLASAYYDGDCIVPMLVFGHQGAVQEKNGANWVGTDGSGLLRAGKLVDTLNAKETRGAMWITGDLKDAEFDIPSPTDGKNISFIVKRTRSKVKAQVKGDEIRFQIDCEGNARVILSNSKIDLSDPNRLEQVESTLENELEQRIRQAVGKSKQVRTDAFQFGRYVEWRYPGKWHSLRDEWRQTYAEEVKVDPRVRIKVKWFGAVREPSWNRLMPGGAEEST